MKPYLEESSKETAMYKIIPSQDNRLKAGSTQSCLFFVWALLWRVMSAMTMTPERYVIRTVRKIFIICYLLLLIAAAIGIDDQQCRRRNYRQNMHLHEYLCEVYLLAF